MSTSFEHTVLRLWRAQHTECPSAAVDQAILAAARRQGARGRPHWYAVAASVATIGLAVGLGWRLSTQYGGPGAPPGHETGAGPTLTATASEPLPAAAPPMPPAMANGTGPAAPVSRPDVQAPTPSRAAAPPPVEASSTAARREALAPPPPARMAPAPLVATTAAATADDRSAQPKSAAAPVAAEAKERTRAEAPAAPSVLELVAPSEAEGAPPRPGDSARASPAEHARSRLDAQSELPADPEAWVARIRALLAAGETEAARALLEHGRRVHPDWPLPKDLRELLE